MKKQLNPPIKIRITPEMVKRCPPDKPGTTRKEFLRLNVGKVVNVTREVRDGFIKLVPAKFPQDKPASKYNKYASADDRELAKSVGITVKQLRADRKAQDKPASKAKKFAKIAKKNSEPLTSRGLLIAIAILVRSFNENGLGKSDEYDETICAIDVMLLTKHGI